VRVHVLRLLHVLSVETRSRKDDPAQGVTSRVGRDDVDTNLDELRGMEFTVVLHHTPKGGSVRLFFTPSGK